MRHEVPGSGARHSAYHHIFRPGDNDWGLIVGDVGGSGEERGALGELVTSAISEAATRFFLPSAALDEVHRVLVDRAGRGEGFQPCTVTLARVELDACGAWVTLAVAGRMRPIVVRRAGWVDVRDHWSDALGLPGCAPGDDRVALGPGDALVLCTEVLAQSPNADGEVFGQFVLPDVLLDCVNLSANAVAERVLAAAVEFGGSRLVDDALVFVLRVPEAVRNGAFEWVSQSTGVPVDGLELPGYPAGDVHPELWRDGRAPPREALIRLAPEPPSVPALRRLLRRLLESWSTSRVVEGDVELLATELASSAFSRTASPVTVIARYTGSVIRVEVGDGARALPRRTRRGFEDISGFRLALVESLASDWGFSRGANGGRAWFEVPTARNGADRAR